jgi:hypothetical protein
MNNILKEIQQERKNQDNIWGVQNHKPIEWVGILTEEVGEASREAVNHHFQNGLDKLKKEGGREIMIASIQEDRLKRYREEMIQVAAVAVAMVESLDRNELKIVKDKCLQKCESCEKETDIETMQADDDSNWFCTECWEVLSPIMKADFKELVKKGEI